MTWYNENNAFAADWLRLLIQAGQISRGPINEQSISSLGSDDCEATSHFFAGIGGWDYALQLAGWPPGLPVWTGSCPCQPFSAAGKKKGTEDERHLWPVWLKLIAECRPPTIFGEQVASPLGREWFTGVRADLEALGYAVGCADLCVASVSAPGIRQRLFWVAYSTGMFGPKHEYEQRAGSRGAEGPHDSAERGRAAVGVADADVGGRGARIRQDDERQPYTTRRSEDSGVVLPNGTGRQQGRLTTEAPRYRGPSLSAGCTGGLGNASIDRERPFNGESAEGPRQEIEDRGSGLSSFWSDSDFIYCADEKCRRIESSTFPLAYGFPKHLRPLRARLEGMGYSPKEVRRILRRPRTLLALASRSRNGRLRGYGNAINPQVAAVFIQAYQETMRVTL